MLAMLGLGKLKIVLLAGAVAAVATLVGVLYLQNQSLRSDLSTSEANNSRLELAVEMQKGAIEATNKNVAAWKKAHEELKGKIEELSNVQRAATAEARRLSEIFSKHDLEALSLAKPGLVERRIDAGSRGALRVLERLSAGDIHEPSGPGAAPGSSGSAQP